MDLEENFHTPLPLEANDTSFVMLLFQIEVLCKAKTNGFIPGEATTFSQPEFTT